jgi:hypothetical protein
MLSRWQASSLGIWPPRQYTDRVAVGRTMTSTLYITTASSEIPEPGSKVRNRYRTALHRLLLLAMSG